MGKDLHASLHQKKISDKRMRVKKLVGNEIKFENLLLYFFHRSQI